MDQGIAPVLRPDCARPWSIFDQVLWLRPMLIEAPHHEVSPPMNSATSRTKVFTSMESNHHNEQSTACAQRSPQTVGQNAEELFADGRRGLLIRSAGSPAEGDSLA